jgi:hypothetical protein
MLMYTGKKPIQPPELVAGTIRTSSNLIHR